MNDNQSTRPEKVFDLGEFVTGQIAASSAVDVPDPLTASQGQAANSAPSGHHWRAVVQPDTFNTHGLIEPVMDESKVLLSSSATSSSSSVVMRHKQAAGGALGRWNSYGGVESRRRRDFAEEQDNIESEYVRIQEKNEGKRIDHSTT